MKRTLNNLSRLKNHDTTATNNTPSSPAFKDMEPFVQINNFIKKYNLITKDSHIILGLSGGPDSVFLLHFLTELLHAGKIKKLTAAHLDHEWRKDSSKDTQFCRNIAKKYKVPLAEGKISDLCLKLKFSGSKEELGRRARRYFLEKIKKEEQADLIALAHHAQDQQETFFIRLIRGSALSGLTAMKPKYGPYIRPLLEINKKDIIDFLHQNNLPYLVDPSNTSEEFLRNRIRKFVLPALKKCDDRFDTKFKETLERLSQTDQFLQALAAETFNKLSTENKGVFFVNIKELLSLAPVLQYTVVMHWLCRQKVKFPVSESFLDEILKFLHQPGSKEHQIHHSWSLIKKKGIVHIRLLPEKSAS